MPTQEIQAIKTNIGLVILTNMSIFLFLIQVRLSSYLLRVSSFFSKNIFLFVIQVRSSSYLLLSS
jgi:hypothetical protein